MRNALDTLATYSRMDPTALGQYLLDTGNIFTPDRSSAYHIKRDAAQLFILDLQRYIGLVERMYWPRAQTAPKYESIEREPTNVEWLGLLQTPEGQKQLKRQIERLMAKDEPKSERTKAILRRVLWGVSSEQ
ncbi:hypothetical protein BST39_24380 [Mycobacterium paraseoulense]|uniref:Uncharacterized protein n=2 Tax=Mycobacterium paraseoulense TaxID=590652 RepID=A0A1X0I3Z2_9MYCO|nr:hypothetical protein BST39_24380 [Mycobacterium paraseoulense]